MDFEGKPQFIIPKVFMDVGIVITFAVIRIILFLFGKPVLGFQTEPNVFIFIVWGDIRAVPASGCNTALTV